jgi:selenide,water dikinase
VRTESGGTIPYDALIWVTQGAPQPWVLESGLATDDRGFIEVDETLRSTSHPFVFAAGDIAFMRHAPRPKSGVFAVRQGPYLSSNIRRTLRGEPLEKYTPQKQFLSLISTGDPNAIASRGRFAFEGAWVWKWKDRIDRAFMEKYDATDTGGMNGPGAMDPMRCGGCGSKVGSDALAAALRAIEQPRGEGIVIGLESPDDAAVVQLPAGTLAVQSVDFFRAFIDDPYVLGKVTAHHCLTDLYAMGATATHPSPATRSQTCSRAPWKCSTPPGQRSWAATLPKGPS